MDLSETLIRFLGSFLFAIAVLYGAFFYLKKNPRLLTFTKNRIPLKQSLQIESVLPLEARKNLYVVRSGKERFLLATSLEGTQFLSRLDSDESQEEEVVLQSQTLTSTHPNKPDSPVDPMMFRDRYKVLNWLYQRFGDVLKISQGSFQRLKLKRLTPGTSIQYAAQSAVLRREVTT